jgi:tRNA(Ile)-lysidine synthase
LLGFFKLFSVSKRRINIHTALAQRIAPGGRVLAAVSGGRDSMVLVDGLLNIARLRSLVVEVCHVNHRLRESSDRDAEFVLQWCSRNNILCHVICLDAKPYGENLEAWARGERYKAFRSTMVERGLDTLCTAHTANDVAETLLMRLVANKELNSIEESDPRRQVVRPLIEISRDQINQYVSEWKLEYVEDPTNQDVEFVRNRVRHELLPLLIERFDKSSVWILAERARSLAADGEALESLALGVVNSIGDIEERDEAWLQRCRTKLSGVPAAVRWRAVRILFTPLLGFTVGESKAEAILAALGERGGVVQLSGNVSVCVSQRGLEIRAADLGRPHE